MESKKSNEDYLKEYYKKNEEKIIKYNLESYHKKQNKKREELENEINKMIINNDLDQLKYITLKISTKYPTVFESLLKEYEEHKRNNKDLVKN